MRGVTPVINAAGKLTALGGSAQSEAVARAQADAAGTHVDLADLRARASEKIAEWTGAEAACITTGAAAGIAISVAAVLTGNNIYRVQQLPWVEGNNHILLQAGHAVNFGAPVEQMISLGGGSPWILGNANAVPERLLADVLNEEQFAGFLYVQSHHCVQENMIPLERCIALGHEHAIPVILDAAAEEDLRRYVAMGVDLVTYSGGKAFGGPTVGFIAGKRPYITACELQFRGIARTMKVGKEQIAGLMTALDEYVSGDPAIRREKLQTINRFLLDGLADTVFETSLRPDEAGRAFERVAIRAGNKAFDVRELVKFLGEGSPAIRTRNHHLDQGIVLIDPREITEAQARIVLDRLLEFAGQL